MDSLASAARILTDAGYILENCEAGFLCIKDPTCVWPILHEFISNAWMVLAVITGFLLAGWGITMLRGASHDMMKNLRDLVLIFGSLSVALPVVDVLGLSDTLVDKCDTIKVSQEQINAFYQDYNIKQELYEEYDIQDTDPLETND